MNIYTRKSLFLKFCLYCFADVPKVELSEVLPVCFGSETTITSVISSKPTHEKIEWQKSKDKSGFHIIRNGKDSKSSLVIHKTTFADRLYYRLVVWNGIGKSISNTVQLTVTGSMILYLTHF